MMNATIVSFVLISLSMSLSSTSGYLILRSKPWHHQSSSPAPLQDSSSNNNFLESIFHAVDVSTRPSYIRAPRKFLNLPFAVQLMRSSYNAVDELNCYPMDRFQKDFFLFRQNEWESYKQVYPNIMQGNLADPNYFDFISFAQYATISNTFQHAMTDFIEKSGAEGTSSVIRRSPSISSNTMLPELHSRLVGQKLFE